MTPNLLDLRDFITESNRIEGINRVPTAQELAETGRFLKLNRVTIADLERLALVYALGRGILRSKTGMDVVIGTHRAPAGGPSIKKALKALLDTLATSDPFSLHIAYETLHPFMDGNGRTGRALFLWQMMRLGAERLLNIGFLHFWYYQSLDEQRCQAAPSDGAGKGQD